jgi:hypothetical protein
MILTLIKKAVQNFIPDSLRAIVSAKLAHSKHQRFLNRLKLDIIKYYSSKTVLSEEVKEVVGYLAAHPMTVFPYDFQKKYNKENINVLLDTVTGLHFVLHDNKKLFFKRSYSIQKIKSLYHGLLLDQDLESPHLYLTENFDLTENDVIADIGAAEGNFSLTNVERVKKLYLFECDEEWIEALEATFKPWKEKVFICNKFVSNTITANSISLDKFVEDHQDITFLKVDIEGEEANFLAGSAGFLQSKRSFKMAICTYHKQEDEAAFTALLQEYDLQVARSARFMIFYHDAMICAPYLRRGLLRAQKNALTYD